MICTFLSNFQTLCRGEEYAISELFFRFFPCLFTWKLPGVDETPNGLLCIGEPIPGGDGVRIDELLGILKLGRFLVKLCNT